MSDVTSHGAPSYRLKIMLTALKAALDIKELESENDLLVSRDKEADEEAEIVVSAILAAVDRLSRRSIGV